MLELNNMLCCSTLLPEMASDFGGQSANINVQLFMSNIALSDCLHTIKESSQCYISTCTCMLKCAFFVHFEKMNIGIRSVLELALALA